MCNEEYFQKEKSRAKKLFSKKKHNSEWNSSSEFAEWFVEKLKEQQCKCYYCDTSIQDINRLINANSLKERKIGYGWRGRILEVDKDGTKYVKETCVLACYYCNNDKSYIFSKKAYKDNFGANRKQYFETLLNQI